MIGNLLTVRQTETSPILSISGQHHAQAGQLLKLRQESIIHGKIQGGPLGNPLFQPVIRIFAHGQVGNRGEQVQRAVRQFLLAVGKIQGQVGLFRQ